MRKAGLFQLTPFIVFIGLFLCSALWFSSKISPLFSCLVAIVVSLFTFIKPLSFNERVAVFIRGASEETVISMIFIFIFTSVFTHVLGCIGGVDIAVAVGLSVIPHGLMLPGLFTLVALFAIAVGSSMGTIAAFLPIGIGIASKLGVDNALMAGLVVGGAMLGDNLSIISDTTIAATQTTGCRMHDKFKANVPLVACAFVFTFGLLWYLSLSSSSLMSITTRQWSSFDGLKLLPYGVVFTLALFGIDVIAVLLMGILCAVGIGIAFGTFSFVEGTTLLLEGFSRDRSIHEVMMLSLLVAGLAKISEFNGGLDYVLSKVSKKVRSRAGSELVIALLIMLVNMAVAINTVAILVTGPVARKIGDRFSIPKKRVAALLDIFSCVCQGVLPYAPQLLLAASIAGVSSISIIPYLHYQGFIFLVAMVSIIRGMRR